MNRAISSLAFVLLAGCVQEAQPAGQKISNAPADIIPSAVEDSTRGVTCYVVNRHVYGGTSVAISCVPWSEQRRSQP